MIIALKTVLWCPICILCGGSPWPIKLSAQRYTSVIMSAISSQISRVSIVRVQIKENTKAPRDWPLWGGPPVTDGFPSQRTSNAEIWWRHHAELWLDVDGQLCGTGSVCIGFTFCLLYSQQRFVSERVGVGVVGVGGVGWGSRGVGGRGWGWGSHYQHTFSLILKITF